MGLLRASLTMDTAGRRFRGEDLIQRRKRDWNRLCGNDIAIVLQNPKYSLNPDQTIDTQIMESLVLHHGLAAANDRKNAGDVNLGRPAGSRKLCDHYLDQLSGGTKQRIMLAITLIKDPRLLGVY